MIKNIKTCLLLSFDLTYFEVSFGYFGLGIPSRPKGFLHQSDVTDAMHPMRSTMALNTVCKVRTETDKYCEGEAPTVGD